MAVSIQKNFIINHYAHIYVNSIVTAKEIGKQKLTKNRKFVLIKRVY